MSGEGLEKCDRVYKSIAFFKNRWNYRVWRGAIAANQTLNSGNIRYKSKDR
ncbi:MAG: hypothetical protein HC903_15785 [Methylacidiphilales bacterium]|nr:hypothetical protein [Candidatus Methylacidiphilales bacterium]NJR19011.1 hypothetical protein [Calothrix sp. CSU_2_0]